jgi:hypothetical protein
MYFDTTPVVSANVLVFVWRLIKKQIYYFHKIRFKKNPGELLLMFNENILQRYSNNMPNTTIAGQRFRKHGPTAKTKSGINTRYNENRSLQTNSV